MNPDQKALVEKYTELQSLLNVSEKNLNRPRIVVLMIELRELSDKPGIELPDELFIVMNQDSRQCIFALALGLIAQSIGGIV